MYSYVKEVTEEDKVILHTTWEEDLEMSIADLKEYANKGNIVCGYNRVTGGVADKTEKDLIKMVLSRARLLGSKEEYDMYCPDGFEYMEIYISKPLAKRMEEYRRVVNTCTEITELEDNKIKVRVYVRDDLLEYANFVYLTYQLDIMEYVRNKGIKEELYINLEFDIDTSHIKVLYSIVDNNTFDSEKYKGYISKLSFTERCNFKGVIAIPYMFTTSFTVNLYDNETGEALPLDLSALDFSNIECYDAMFYAYSGGTDVIMPKRYNPVIKSMYNAFVYLTNGSEILNNGTPLGNFVASIEDVKEDMQFSVCGNYYLGFVNVPPNILKLISKYTKTMKEEDYYVNAYQIGYYKDGEVKQSYFKAPVYLWGDYTKYVLNKDMLNVLLTDGVLKEFLSDFSKTRTTRVFEFVPDISLNYELTQRFVEEFPKLYKVNYELMQRFVEEFPKLYKEFECGTSFIFKDNTEGKIINKVLETTLKEMYGSNTANYFTFE